MGLDDQPSEVFNSTVKIEVGSGSSILFWKDLWIKGCSVVDIALLMLSKVLLTV